MKKFLSLVLALVMTMSLVTVSAGAKDFTDSTKIQYAEAVDVMSAVKVIDGYTDGSFNPSATLTRGAAAKIICNLILGPTTASALVADAAPYKDVPTNHTFAGYIAYCQKEGIISGYADGTFKPANSLTGYAFMKMLLGALGYKADQEGYTGPNWSINVAKRALNVGLYDDLVGSFNGVKAVNREEACLYAFNTMKATMVEYDNNNSVTVNGITFTNKSAAKEMANTAKVETIKDDNKMQFAEKYFDKLKVSTKSSDKMDDFGRPATTWIYDGDTVGTYADSADYKLVLNKDLSYVDMMTENDDYFNLKAKDISADIEVYQNGTEITAATYAAVSGGEAVKYFQAGDVVELFENDDDDVETVVVTRYTLAKIDDVDNDLSSSLQKKGAKYAIDLKDLDNTGFADSNLNGTYYDDHDDDEKVLNGFDADTYTKDVVLAVVVKTDGTILASHVAEAVTGSITKYNSGSKAKVTMAGTEYALTAKTKGQVTAFDYNDSTYTIYVNADGYVVGFETTGTAKLEDVYYITGVVRDANGLYNTKSYYAQAVSLKDGKVSEIKLEAESFAELMGMKVEKSSDSADTAFYMVDVSGSYYKQPDGKFATTVSGTTKYERKTDWTDVMTTINGVTANQVAGSKGLYTFTDKDGSKGLDTKSNNGKFFAEAYNHAADNSYYVTTATTLAGSEDLKRDASSITLSSPSGDFTKKVYVNDKTQYVKVEKNGDDIDVKLVTGGTSATNGSLTGVYAVATKSGANYTAAYVVLASNSFSSAAADADIVYVDEGSSKKVASDKWELDVYFLDGTGKTTTVTADTAAADNSFYDFTINDDGEYELGAQNDSQYTVYAGKTADFTYDKETGFVKGATLTGIYNNQLTGTASFDSSKTFTMNDVDFASNVIVIDSRSKSDRNDQIANSEITTVAKLKSALEKTGVTGVTADVYLDDGEVVLVSVTASTPATPGGSGSGSTTYVVNTGATLALTAGKIDVTGAVITKKGVTPAAGPDSTINGTVKVVAEAYANGEWKEFATATGSATVAATTGAVTVPSLTIGVVTGTPYKVTVTMTADELGTVTLASGTYSF